uniref:Tripartite motif containing protein 3 n=1 Tax=Echinococcus granulosus TaxID=6210 RepID=A0A068WYS5_ECHGR|nr:tripartite motif containing protein 3 [Echinococcus granulosus]
MYKCTMGFEGDGAAVKENVQSALEHAALQMLSHLRNRCEELDDALVMLDSAKKEMEGQINQCFQTILRTLEERRLALFSDLESSLLKRRHVIEELMKNMEERSQKLTVTTELIKQYYIHEKGFFNGVKGGKFEETNHEDGRRNAEEQLRSLLANPVPIHPSTSDILSYFPINLDKLLSLIKNFGAIGMTSVDSDQTSIVETGSEGSHVMRCVVNEVYFQKVRAVDSQGRDVGVVNPKEFSVSLTHRPVHMNEVSVIEPESKSLSPPLDNSVLIRLKLSNPGFYELNVKVLGEHIRNSPYRVHCLPKMGPLAKEWKAVFNELSEHAELRRGPLQYIKRSSSELHLPTLPPPPQALADALSWNKNGMIFAIGARGRGVSEFACPQGAMFTRDNKLVIVDSNNANVQVFTSSGAFLRRFGEFGSEAGQMVRPTSVAETINSNYLISDFDLHCIHVFQPSGSYMSRFGQRNLAGPYDVAVDSRGKIFVVDLKACTVCYFKPTGRFLGHFGARGAADNQFTGPTGIAIDSTDQVYVVDSPVHSIKVFDNDGEFLFKFGVNGYEPGCLHLPSRLVFYPHDLLLISDTGNNRVQVFDKEGQYLWMFTSSLDALNDPRDIAILPNDGLIAIVDTGNYCIKAFNLQNRQANNAVTLKECNDATLTQKPIEQNILIEKSP